MSEQIYHNTQPKVNVKIVGEMQTMYPGMANSPATTLTANVGAGDSVIPISAVSAFPEAPNIAVIGTDSDAETILYAAKTENALSGCVRGLEGTVQSWPKDTPIARNFTNYDYAQLTANIKDLYAAKASAHDPTFSGTVFGITKDMVGLGDVDNTPDTDKPVSTPQKQAIAAAVNSAVRNQNLLDNWHFGSPVNQRQQTVYSNTGYMIDRWWGIFCRFDVDNKTLEAYGSTQYGGVLRQPIAFAKNLAGKTVTVTINVAQVLGTASLSLIKSSGLNAGMAHVSYKAIQSGSTSFTVTLPDDIGSDAYPMLLLSINVSIGSRIIFDGSSAIKLELGSVSTLAHDPPPDFGAELAKCQRYQVRLAVNHVGYSFANAHAVFVHIPTPVILRAKPTIATPIGDVVIRADGADFVGCTLSVRALTPTGIECSCTPPAGSSLIGRKLYGVIASPYLLFDANL